MSFTNPCPVCGFLAEMFFGQLQTCIHQDKEIEKEEEE